METSQLLTELTHRGIALTVDGDNLRYVAPSGALTDELRQAISYHKAEVIEQLRPREASERKPPPQRKASFLSPEREPGEDEAGIDGEWPQKAWSLADWVKGARGDFHVFERLLGAKPISRGFSWRD